MALASAQARTIQTSIPEKIMGYPNKVWRKKIFSSKSMTKLEDLTVLYEIMKNLERCE